MSVAMLPFTLMSLGLIAQQRAMLMSTGTMPNTIAYLEAERAAGFAALLCILTAPWLVIVAIIQLVN